MKKHISFTVVTLITFVLLTSFAQAETEIPLTASASSSHWSYSVGNAVDNNLNSYWQSGYSWWSRTTLLRLDCNGVYNLSKISIWWDRSFAAATYDIQGSQDGNTWTDLYTGLNGSGGSSNPYLVSYDLSANVRYIRIYIRKMQSYFTRIYEVKLFSSSTTNQAPTAEAQANPTSGVAPLEVRFTGSGQDVDGSIISYRWVFGDGATSGQQNPTHTYTNPATYTAALTVTDDAGETAEDSVIITVSEPANQPPTVEATAQPTSGIAPLTVFFTAGATDADGTIAGYAWDFGDDALSTEENPTHTYNNPGNYTATLTVTDNDNGIGSDSVNITITESVEEIPHLIRFQGRLGNEEETPLSGTFTLTFRLYETDTGGEPIWEEVQYVNVEEGLVDVELGSVTAFDLPFDKQYWLGVEVGDDGEMSPRFKLTTVPYTLNIVQ